MDHGSLPEGVVIVRTTDELDSGSVPPGLLRAHHLAAAVHGCLRVRAGTVRFVWEGNATSEVVELEAGDSLVIPPQVLHHVEPSPDARFVIEFHR